MELREPIEKINYLLEREFGKEFNGQPRWRVVFSDDQFEKRYTDHTAEGIELLYPEVRELPKYRQYIHQKYILEHLVPVNGETDLTVKINYEPAWVFQDKNGSYLPPWFEGCRFVIESVYAQIGMKGHAKYKDPNVSEEYRAQQIQKMQNELFGNETEVGDHLNYNTGVVVPGPITSMSEATTQSTAVEVTAKQEN